MDTIDSLARQLAAQAIQSAIDTVNRAFDGATAPAVRYSRHGSTARPFKARGGSTKAERARQMRREDPNVSIAVIARAVGASAASVKQALRSAGLHRPMPVGRPPAVIVSDDEIRRLHGEGKSDVVIARMVGLSQTCVSDRRRGLGLPALFTRIGTRIAP